MSADRVAEALAALEEANRKVLDLPRIDDTVTASKFIEWSRARELVLKAMAPALRALQLVPEYLVVDDESYCRSLEAREIQQALEDLADVVLGP